jgi:arylamine N-acetyltransferase
MMTPMRFDDDLRRIGQRPPADASLDALRRLHLAHREAFLFENLSIQTGGAIGLGLADLDRKFLDEGRGGSCFEHNTLFAAALAEVANHFTSTHPESIFRKTLTIQRSGRDERGLLRSDSLTRYRKGRMVEEPVTRARLHAIVRAEFGIDLPDGPFVFEAQPPR